MKYLVGFTLCFICLPFWSQNKIYTSIQANSTDYPKTNFYFEHILDRRINKENIGFIYKSSLTYLHPADFKKSLAQEFLHFLRTTYPTKQSSNRILMAVNQFEIAHLVSGNKIDTGKVNVNFDFYLLRNDSAFFLYNFKNDLKETSNRITYSHPNRMKRAVLLSLIKLDSVLSLKNQVFAFNLKDISDSVRTSNSSLNKSNLTGDDSLIKINNYPSERFLFLGAHSDFALNSIAVLANVDLVFQLKKHPRVLLGPTLNYLIYNQISEASLPVNTEYKVDYVEFGMRILNQLKKDLFFNFQSQFLFGKETYDRQNYYYSNGVFIKEPSSITSESLFGADFNVGLYIIPAKKQNFYAGGDVFVRTTTSGVLEGAFGIKINLGFKF